MSSQMDSLQEVLRSRFRADERHRYLQGLNSGQLQRTRNNSHYNDFFPPRTIHINPTRDHGQADERRPGGQYNNQRTGEPVIGDSFRRRRRNQFFNDHLAGSGSRHHFDRPIRPDE